MLEMDAKIKEHRQKTIDSRPYGGIDKNLLNFLKAYNGYYRKSGHSMSRSVESADSTVATKSTGPVGKKGLKDGGPILTKKQKSLREVTLGMLK
mmetsp:Transcript_5427/g.6469  ORF Transcript_5427/g.6469 Transcript_5427/m.6469 type:complete len:94 (+) Transcript_5427:254-535(+)